MLKNSTITDPAKEFWGIWQQERDTLYRYCVNWMNGNATNAEEALSCAMVKAWEKFQDDNSIIRNLKAWLTRLTRNFCIDIHRQRKRKTIKIESIEVITEPIISKEAIPDLVA